jgi:hypothetical protein
MVLLKCPFGDRSSTLTGYGKRSKTVDATHPSISMMDAFPDLPANFGGTILAGSYIPGTSTLSANTFVLLTISGDGGVLSAYPMSAAPNISNITVPNIRKGKIAKEN